MSDSTAPPVSPSEGQPSQPTADASKAFMEKLEVDAEEEKYRYMASQVPANMQEDFLAAHPPTIAKTPAPKDMEDVRQAKAKRGDPAPNEPKEYLEIGPDVANLPQHSDNLPPTGAPAEGGGTGGEAPATSRKMTVDAIKKREQDLVQKSASRSKPAPSDQASQPAGQVAPASGSDPQYLETYHPPQ